MMIIIRKTFSIFSWNTRLNFYLIGRLLTCKSIKEKIGRIRIKIVDNGCVIFLDIICAFIVHTFLLSPPPMFFRETRYCIIYFLYSSSAVIWTMQPDACFFRFVLRSVWMTLSSASVRHTSFEVTENTKQCLLLLTIFFSLFQCWELQEITPIIAILFF
jgi:hypothetical protein